MSARLVVDRGAELFGSDVTIAFQDNKSYYNLPPEQQLRKVRTGGVAISPGFARHTQVGADGRFSATVPVSFGTTVLTAGASDHGRTGQAQRTVIGELTGGTTALDVPDPSGDDHGPGTYAYPTAADFHAGAFDLERFQVISDASTVYLQARLRDRPYEVFCCIYLDNRHRPIAFEELFRGTVDCAQVHPREVLRQALLHNAIALIVAHNHPSGALEPSPADDFITRRLKDLLALMDVRLVDHIIVGDTRCYSFAEHGLL